MKLFRIGVIGTKRPSRQYLSLDKSGQTVELVGRQDALHWPRAIADMIVSELNTEFELSGRAERFQIEQS